MMKRRNSVAAANWNNYVACHITRLVLVMICFAAEVSGRALSTSLTSLLANAGGCELNCEHGYCEHVEGDYDTRQTFFQSGRMLQRCSCQFGWTGTGCELEVQKCDVETLTCPNGHTCETNAKGTNNCECSVADALSDLASRQCRKPYTEYCNGGKYDPSKPLSFCTNGGVCRGSLMAAAVAPGNTSVNVIYEHEGCICPREYYGPHCEFLHHSLASVVEPVKSSSSSLMGSTSSSYPSQNTNLSTTVIQNQDFKGSAKSIEDLIHGYNEYSGDDASAESNVSTKSQSDDSNNNTLLVWLLSVVGILGLGFAVVILKKLHNRRKHQRLQQDDKNQKKSAPKPKHPKSTNNGKGSTKSAKQKKPPRKAKTNRPILQTRSDDMNSFTVDNDGQTMTTWTSSWSHDQSQQAIPSTVQGDCDGSVTHQLDSYWTGTRIWLPTTQQNCVVAENESDGLTTCSDLYSNGTDAQQDFSTLGNMDAGTDHHQSYWAGAIDDNDFHLDARQKQKQTASLWDDRPSGYF